MSDLIAEMEIKKKSKIANETNCVQYDNEYKTFDIFHFEDDMTKEPDYFIYKKDIDNKSKLLKWILHLTEKNWITTHHIRLLIYNVSQICKINIYEF